MHKILHIDMQYTVYCKLIYVLQYIAYVQVYIYIYVRIDVYVVKFHKYIYKYNFEVYTYKYMIYTVYISNLINDFFVHLVQ